MAHSARPFDIARRVGVRAIILVPAFVLLYTLFAASSLSAVLQAKLPIWIRRHLAALQELHVDGDDVTGDAGERGHAGGRWDVPG